MVYLNCVLASGTTLRLLYLLLRNIARENRSLVFHLKAWTYIHSETMRHPAVVFNAIKIGEYLYFYHNKYSSSLPILLVLN